jgi:hypothetical protein
MLPELLDVSASDRFETIEGLTAMDQPLAPLLYCFR